MTFTASAPPPPQGWLRAWFRRRLARAPRRWVLFLAGAEGLVGTSAFLASREVDEAIAALAELAGAGLLALAPAAAVLGLYVHARLLYWGGKALGGVATPAQLRCALAWSTLPVLVTGWPHVLRKALLVAQLDREVVPVGLRVASDLAEGLSAVAAHGVVALPVALCSGALYVTFVAEAQRFSKWRAVADHLLAAILLVALPAAGVALGWVLQGSRLGLTALCAAAIALVAWRLRIGLVRARQDRRAPAPLSAGLR